MRALIIADIQYDFLPGGPLAVNMADEILPVVNAIQADYDLVVATQDWHPWNHGSFASQHPHKKPFDVIDLNGLAQILWPDHCVQGSSGAALSSDLDTRRVEAIFRKGMDENIDSYSAFFDNGKRKATGLSGYLVSRGVTDVHVCGLAADFCVYFTAKDALDLGFKSAILENATRAIDPSEFILRKTEFEALGGLILNA